MRRAVELFHRFFHFSPSWNIDLRARPWALWNFLWSTSPLTHRCRNIIPPARYFNLALSTRQGPEKKNSIVSLPLSVSLPFLCSLFPFSPILPIFRGRLDASDSSRTSPQETWMENGNNSLPDRRSDVARARACVCVWNGITWRIRERNRIVVKSSSILWNHFQFRKTRR